MKPLWLFEAQVWNCQALIAKGVNSASNTHSFECIRCELSIKHTYLKVWTHYQTRILLTRTWCSSAVSSQSKQSPLQSSALWLAAQCGTANQHAVHSSQISKDAYHWQLQRSVIKRLPTYTSGDLGWADNLVSLLWYHLIQQLDKTTSYYLSVSLISMMAECGLDSLVQQLPMGSTDAEVNIF